MTELNINISLCTSQTDLLIRCNDLNCTWYTNLYVTNYQSHSLKPYFSRKNRVLLVLPATMESLDSLAFPGPQAPLDHPALVEYVSHLKERKYKTFVTDGIKKGLQLTFGVLCPTHWSKVSFRPGSEMKGPVRSPVSAPL